MRVYAYFIPNNISIYKQTVSTHTVRSAIFSICWHTITAIRARTVTATHSNSRPFETCRPMPPASSLFRIWTVPTSPSPCHTVVTTAPMWVMVTHRLPR